MIYKYYGASNGSSALELLKKIVENNTLMASKPFTFNDPFEFKIAIDFDADDETIQKRYFKDNPTKTFQEYQNWKQGFIQSQWYVRQSLRVDILNKFGVICLTNEFQNHLMWSHYATDHQGFCIGFDKSIVKSIEGVMWHENVNYLDEIPVFRYFYDNENEFPKKVLFSKLRDWQYEKEFRIITDKQGIVNLSIPCVREVILGCRAFNELRQYADEKLDTNENLFYQMVENDQKYSLNK